MERLSKESLEAHKKLKGKIEIKSKIKLNNIHDLSIAYTPGVAEPCRQIFRNREKIYDLTSKWNTIAIVTDGSAVLGLGNIGADASLPVMEGKAVLFKQFGDVDAFPICINSQDTDKIVETVKLISPAFGGINLEDISAPRCFLIEEKLKRELDIPVFHDDQHGTAVVVYAALLSALQLVSKQIDKIKVVILGAGAAGIAISKLLTNAGCRNILICDRAGIIHKNREGNMNFAKKEISEITNPENLSGTLADATVGADVFIGVSGPGLVTGKMVKNMNKEAVVFAMSNPVPEIAPEEAKRAGARIIGTGRSDMPNQINNVLAFPGIFRGALDVRSSDINEEMKIAAAEALSSLISNKELRDDYIIVNPFDKRIKSAVSRAVAKAAKSSGVARK
ncbi:NADP-dependent malic enzyme [bacterium]|nr:NADP-dependent malic enzyme [bacterium]